MKKYSLILVGLAFVVLLYCNQKPTPPSIIFDTDIAPDYDDVGALAMLHAFADKREARILATISCNSFSTTAPTLSVINTYFKRPAIPIGVLKSDQPKYSCPRLWAQGIILKYPHNIRDNALAQDAVTLYRKVLSVQPDTSVTIVTVGFLTNLSNLLNSSADKYSKLDGLALVKQKVKCLVSMAAGIDSTGNSGYEANIMADIPAAQNVFSKWPTRIVLSGFEIGVNIFTGIELINNSAIQNSPVKDAYRIALDYDGTKEGRYNWDQTAVLVAVKGANQYFDTRKIDMLIKDDGKDSVITGNRITYLIAKQTPEKMAKLIEDFMMHQPGQVADKATSTYNTFKK